MILPIETRNRPWSELLQSLRPAPPTAGRRTQSFFGRMTNGQMLAVAAQVVDEDFASRHSKDKKGNFAASLEVVFNPPADASDA